MEISGHEDSSSDPYQMVFIVKDTKNFALFELAEAMVETVIAFVPSREKAEKPGLENWNEWMNGRFRKLLKRMKAAHFDKLHEELSNSYIEHYLYEKGNVELIALSPQKKSFNHPALKRAQVSGLSVVEKDYVNFDDTDYVITMNDEIGMSPSKAAVAAAHAAQLLKEELHEQGSIIKMDNISIDLGKVDANDFLYVRDAGLTEVEPGSITASVKKV